MPAVAGVPLCDDFGAGQLGADLSCGARSAWPKSDYCAETDERTVALGCWVGSAAVSRRCADGRDQCVNHQVTELADGR